MMKWEKLLSLQRMGDTQLRERIAQDETRLGFEVDYDRIIFSSAFRSLQDKTQVVPLSKTDFVHNRLTHSLEVSVVGRSLGRLAGQFVLEQHPHLKELGYKMNDFGAIVAAACLTHDIGNPPFGHSGEKAIGEFFSHGAGAIYQKMCTPQEWQDLIKFEGNANGFAFLAGNRNGIEGGLRLSYATLGAFMKYPKPSLPHQPTPKAAHKKFGYFASEQSFFEEVAQQLGLLEETFNGVKTFARHPLAYLVEAADDICYTIIDFEDGINLGMIEESFALEYLINLVKDHLDGQKYSSLAHTSDRISYLRALAINRLLQDALAIFKNHESEILAGTFEKSLLSKSKFKAQIDDIIKISVAKIYQSPEVLNKEIKGHHVIHTLLHHFCDAVMNEAAPTHYQQLILQKLPAVYQEKNKTAYEKLWQISHFVSMLTDGKAVELSLLLKT